MNIYMLFICNIVLLYMCINKYDICTCIKGVEAALICISADRVEL